MEYLTLIKPAELITHVGDPNWAIIDCRFTLGDEERGRKDYLKSHIPGAVYAHLNDDLCGPMIQGITGRHPLPTIDQLQQRFSSWGIDASVQVVAYDDWPAIGLATAARLWWLLRWLGHASVAVLDGGWTEWISSNLPTRSGLETRTVRKFYAVERPELLAGSNDIDKMRLDANSLVIDSRSADRYRGENETIDPVAGHIPGAKSMPYSDVLAPSGSFLSKRELEAHFRRSIVDIPASNVAFYCGSGVTAAVNVLAIAHAGLGEARLYVGSWSEWITDPKRAVE